MQQFITPMKNRYRLYRRRRGGHYYAHDSKTGKQESLQTPNRAAAQRLIAAKNAAAEQPHLNLELARTYLRAHDPKMITRRWQEVMDYFSSRGRPSTRERSSRAFAGQAFDHLRNKMIVETISEDFLVTMKNRGCSIAHYLRRLQNVALDLGWLAWPILAKAAWPKFLTGSKRAITEGELQKILASEKNPERGRYYRFLWEIGAAQTDAANMTAENINWNEMHLIYWRVKLNNQKEPCCLGIGPALAALLREMPATGPLFPKISREGAKERAAEFRRRRIVAGVSGVTLHSFRYAWAERAYEAGYPERFAQAALGHSSKAVHWAYARGAKVKCPPLEGFVPGPPKIVAFTAGAAATAETSSPATA